MRAFRVPYAGAVLIVLPPSEGKTAPRRGKPLDLATLSFADLTKAREVVIRELVELCERRPDAGEVLGLGPTQTDEVARNASLWDAPTTRAERLYSGVLYDALGLATLSPAARRRAATRVTITSSVFGLLRIGDRVPAYRLSGDVALPGIGSVAGHWRKHLGPAAEDAVGAGLLIDLRSTTYAAFWRPARELAPTSASVRVLHETAGRRSVVSHFNKATKGRLVRDLLESGAAPRTPTALASAWRDLGWTVEQAPPSPRGTRLDVVVADV